MGYLDLSCYICWFLLFLQNVFANQNISEIYPVTTSQLEHGLLVERELSNYYNISRIPGIGLNFTYLLGPANDEYFPTESEKRNYTYSMFESGIGMVAIDIVYQNDDWYIVDNTLTFRWFLQIMANYVSDSNDDITLDPIFFIFKIQHVDNTGGEMTESLLDKLNDDIQDVFDIDNVYTVSEFEGTWPQTHSFLYDDFKRIFFINVNEDENTNQFFLENSEIIFSKSISNYTAFFNRDPIDVACPISSGLDFPIVASDSFNETNILDVLYCGYFPLISNQNITFISTLLNISLVWGWGPGQPIDTHTTKTLKDDDKTLYALACATLQYNTSSNASYWQVNDCHSKFPLLCYSDDLNTWHINSSIKTSFYAMRGTDLKNSMAHGCPSGYRFGIPSTPLQISELNNFLSKEYEKDKENFYFQGANDSVWISLNSISASNCWVVGGSHTVCAYAKYVTTRNFVEMITPLASCILALVIILFFLKIRKIPVQNNRKNWRRIVRESEKDSPSDGVPL